MPFSKGLKATNAAISFAPFSYNFLHLFTRLNQSNTGYFRSLTFSDLFIHSTYAFWFDSNCPEVLDTLQPLQVLHFTFCRWYSSIHNVTSLWIVKQFDVIKDILYRNVRCIENLVSKTSILRAEKSFRLQLCRDDYHKGSCLIINWVLSKNAYMSWLLNWLPRSNWTRTMVMVSGAIRVLTIRLWSIVYPFLAPPTSR